MPEKREELLVEGLGKTYKGRHVVRGISLSVKPGEIVGLLGPNGAGKSTTFYMVSGLIKPEYGRIFIDDREVTDLPIHKRAKLGLSYLPQETSVFRGLTVAENIMAALEIRIKDADKRDVILEELMADFSIDYLKNALAISLSGGERRRLEIARCLATFPKYILLDEPLAGIDPIAVEDIKDLIVRLKDKGIGIIITDHNVRETLDLLDKAYVVYDGKVLIQGTPQEIVQSPDVRKVYLGEDFKV